MSACLLIIHPSLSPSILPSILPSIHPSMGSLFVVSSRASAGFLLSQKTSSNNQASVRRGSLIICVGQQKQIVSPCAPCGGGCGGEGFSISLRPRFGGRVSLSPSPRRFFGPSGSRPIDPLDLGQKTVKRFFRGRTSGGSRWSRSGSVGRSDRDPVHASPKNADVSKRFGVFVFLVNAAAFERKRGRNGGFTSRSSEVPSGYWSLIDTIPSRY